ncbi:hypothetical protein Trydic_g69 [Trypoxylus dichotomus]
MIHLLEQECTMNSIRYVLTPKKLKLDGNSCLIPHTALTWHHQISIYSGCEKKLIFEYEEASVNQYLKMQDTTLGHMPLLKDGPTLWKWTEIAFEK